MKDFVKRPRREPFALQLTAMIDIFSMIVIFLILGTVTGAAEVVFPADFILPQSASKENAESAPQLVISQDKVEFKALQLEFALKDFATDSPELRQLGKKLEDYAKALPPTSTSSGLLLNVMADERVPYEDVFHVLKTFKKSGFETLFFVTSPRKVASE